MASPSLPSALDAWREVIHPAALILPRPAASDFAELKLSIEKAGLLSPLATFVDKRGEHWLLDGVSRLQALIELDRPVVDANGRWAVPTTPYYEEQGIDPYETALLLNVTRRHLTAEQKRDVIRALREERPDFSNRAIARMAGVSPRTVADERRQAEAEAPTSDDAAAESEVHAEGGPAPPRTPKRIESETVATLPARPFIGTVLPSAPKSQRVAEVRRCVKYLQLEIEDMQRRR